MRAVWVDAGNDPQWEKLAAHAITWVFLPVSDPVADVRRRLNDIKARGLRGGLYSAWNWYPEDGAGYAEVMHDRVKEIAPTATPSWPKVQLDDETHDPARIAALLERWRQLRPKTDTSWTLECMQGGWMPPEFVAEVVSRKVRVVPQCYGGQDGRIDYAVDTLVAARDLTKRGFPDALVTPMYDGARLPAMWDGFVFTMGRLP